MALKTIVINFDNNGNQQENGGLVITAQGGNSKPFNKSGGAPANPNDPSLSVLWGGSSSLTLVEGSNCVVIGGRKYCA